MRSIEVVEPVGVWKPWLVASIMATILLVPLIFELPSWSEEQGWLGIAKSISSGGRWNIFLAKSDYPSSFQAYPIGFLVALGASPIEASRYVALLYLLFAAYFYACIAASLSNNTGRVIATATLFSTCCFANFSWVVAGWHEVTHVPLLVAAVSFYFLQVLYKPVVSLRSEVFLAIWLAVSLWTLYSPALFALAILAALLIAPKFHVPSSTKKRILLYSLIFSMPIFVAVLQSDFELLQRHYRWLVFGGEWDNTMYSAQRSFAVAMIETISRTFLTIWPAGLGANFDLSVGIFPELPLALLALFGFGISCCCYRAVIWSVLPFCITTIVLILSNATPWRVSILGAFFVLFAIVGLSRLGYFIKSKKLHQLILATLIFFQIVIFLKQIASFIKAAEGTFANGAISSHIAKSCPAETLQSSLYVPDSLVGTILQAIVPPGAQFFFYPEAYAPGDVLRSLAVGSRVLFAFRRPLERLEGSYRFDGTPGNVMCQGAVQGWSYIVMEKLPA